MPYSYGRSYNPYALRSRYRTERRNRYSSNRVRCYGPSPAVDTFRQRYLRMLDRYFPHLAAAERKKDEERRRAEEEERMPEEEVPKLKTLTVKEVDFHTKENSKQHHTSKFKTGDNPRVILRRGQEFKMTVTFNRAYDKEQDDLVFVFDADNEENISPSKKLYAKFKLTEDGSAPYKKEGEWGATIVKEQAGKQKLELSVYIPGGTVIGDWELKILTEMAGEDVKPKYKHSPSIVILFNPWSEEDLVHYTGKKKDLDEYILNPVGTYYYGHAGSVRCAPWTFGQFKRGILRISLDLLMKAFGCSKTPVMSDPIMVSRALSKMVNSLDDRGVLVGNWSGNYSGGTKPTQWTSSATILKQYDEEGPVRFGQCWVFSLVLVAVCRALGLPCRSVTNFASAHDSDNTCTIDKFYKENGDEADIDKNDSIWNFHVWNEVWLQRPDFPDFDYSGWHVIDATPQELSDGVFQCGPCPVKAVKNGDTNVGFDTAFVFGEVNADEVCWVVNAENEIVNYSCVREKKVGKMISTKPADGQEFKGKLNWFNRDDEEFRCDLTNDYKFPEGSAKEEEAKQKATGHTARGTLLYKHSADVEVWLDEDINPMVGQDVVITAHVKNVSREDRVIRTIMTVCTKQYTNLSRDSKGLAKQRFPDMILRGLREETFTLTVPASAYMANCYDDLRLFGYVFVNDLTDKMPYSTKADFMVDHPDLDVTKTSPAKPGEVVTVKASFTSPCSLSNCSFTMEGDLQVAKDDTNGFRYKPRSGELGTWSKDLGPLKKDEKFEITLRLFGKRDEDEDEDDDDEVQTLSLCFNSDEIVAGIHGEVVLKVKKA